MNYREWKYMKTKFTGVSHTTLNPRGPGVVRIHLVPQRIRFGSRPWPS